MKLKKPKYKKILKLKKKFRFTDFEFITNYGLFSGDTNLFKTLTIFDLVKQTESVKGDIIELVAGPFKGERAQVQRIDEAKDQVTVELYEATVPIPVTVRGDQIRVLDSGDR